MSSASLMFLQLFVAAMTSCQASTEVASPVSVDSMAARSFFQELGLDKALWDSVAEAVLALAVFGAASAMATAYRRRNPKSIRPNKAKFNSLHDPSPTSSKRSGTVVNGHPKSAPGAAARMTAPTVDAPWRKKQLPAVKPLPSAASPATHGATANRSSQSEADGLANAVRAGKAAQLPQLIDSAIARSLRMHTSATEEDVATTLLHSSLRACAANRCFSDAVTAYEYMAERIGEGNPGLFSVLLYCVVEAESFSKCKHVFDKLCKQGKPSGHDFVNMVRCYTRQEDAEGLREILRSLCSLAQFVDNWTLNRALAACGASESALHLADALIESGICVDGLDGVGYNTLMKYNARAGRFSRCFELRAEMTTMGIEASEVTFGILLDACVAAKEIDAAKKVFDDLCSSGLTLNVVHCTTFIKSLLGVGELDEAAAVLREMSSSTSFDVKPDLITYSTVVRAYADAGDVCSALKMLQEMIESGVRADELIFNSVLTGCCVYPMKSSEVMRAFETLLGLGMRPTTTTLSILLKALAHSQAWTTSLQVLKDAPTTLRLEPETRLYVQLAQACVKARATTEVLEIFNAMLEAVSRRGEKADPAIVSRLLRSCALSGDHQVAHQLRDASLRAGIALEPHTTLKTTAAGFTKKPLPAPSALPRQSGRLVLRPGGV